MTKVTRPTKEFYESEDNLKPLRIDGKIDETDEKKVIRYHIAGITFLERKK
jgi:hypothetical protein